MLSLPIQHEQIYFVNFAQPKDLLPPKQLKPTKEVITTNTPLIISSV
jgi:hypothetical protein